MQHVTSASNIFMSLNCFKENICFCRESTNSVMVQLQNYEEDAEINLLIYKGLQYTSLRHTDSLACKNR